MQNLVEQIVDSLDIKLDKAINAIADKLIVKENGIVIEVKESVIVATGFSKIFNNECLIISGKFLGIAVSLSEKCTKIILLDKTQKIKIGDTVQRTKKQLMVPVGKGMIGRVVDGLGNPLDDLGDIKTHHKLPIERPAKSIMQRAPVNTPLETGSKIIDAFIPIGKGQRELILGDRQTGKTSIAIDTILNQKDKDVVCIYCAIGQKDSAIANVIEKLKSEQAMGYTIVIKAGSNELSGHQFIAPYSATSMAEYFMENGKNVLIVYDDLTKHARAYRELSLLLEKAPAREAFPGDVFYIHSRLLERSTKLKEEFGGGSITALPIVETELGNLVSYIPTNIISITDGQIYFSTDYFQKGLLPAIEIGKSVSRVGHQAHLKAYKAISQKLSLNYSQFRELEMFSKFATKLDENTSKIISRGQKISEVLNQNRYEIIPTEEQIAIFLCVNNGIFDDIESDEIDNAEYIIRRTMAKEFPNLVKKIKKNKDLSDKDIDKFIENIRLKLS